MKTSQIVSALTLAAFTAAAPVSSFISRALSDKANPISKAPQQTASADASPAADLAYLFYTAYGAEAGDAPKLMVKRADDGEVSPAADLAYIVYSVYAPTAAEAKMMVKRATGTEASPAADLGYITYIGYPRAAEAAN